MNLHGNIEVIDWTDQVTGLTIRLAQYDVILAAKLYSLHAAAQGNIALGLRAELDNFNHKVLKQMDLGVEPADREAPLYFWVRAMKKRNRLSFEDGEYHIPQALAACIVRCPGARSFVQLLG